MKPSLNTLQDDFLNAWLNQDVASDFTAHIRSDSKLSPQERLGIYQGGILAGLARAVGEIYPVCKQLVGDDFFRGMAYRYVQQTPSKSPNLMDYGSSFSAFVDEFKSAATLPYLSNVCHLEWAWHTAYYSATDSGLNIAALQNLSEAEQQAMILTLPEGSALIQSDYPIHTIWQVNQIDYPNDPVVNLKAGGVKLLVNRQGTEIKIDVLTVDEWYLLSYIDKNMTFATLCEFCELDSKDVDIVSLLPVLLSKSWLGSFSI